MAVIFKYSKHSKPVLEKHIVDYLQNISDNIVVTSMEDFNCSPYRFKLSLKRPLDIKTKWEDLISNPRCEYFLDIYHSTNDITTWHIMSKFLPTGHYTEKIYSFNDKFCYDVKNITKEFVYKNLETITLKCMEYVK